MAICRSRSRREGDDVQMAENGAEFGRKHSLDFRTEKRKKFSPMIPELACARAQLLNICPLEIEFQQ
jgi:hypothetical protein